MASRLPVALSLGLAFAATAAAQEVKIVTVEVVNLPEVQKVTGSVAVSEPIPHTRWVHFGDVVLSPQVPRDDVNRLVSAGVLDTTGFTSVVLSVGGEVKGTVPAAAEIGALLVPDEEFVDDAYARGYILFPLEATAKVPANSAPSVGSEPKRFDLAFPRYRVLLFNTSSRAVTAHVYALLTQ
jgi:hypothetical protein